MPEDEERAVLDAKGLPPLLSIAKDVPPKDGLRKLPNVSFSVLELVTAISAPLVVRNVAAELCAVEDDPKLKIGAATGDARIEFGAVELNGTLSKVAAVPADVTA